MLVFDCICAIATPPGIAGLSVIRLSGGECFAIADACFRGKKPLADVQSHTIHYGTMWQPVLASAKASADTFPLDQVTALVYRAPHSYTGEDVVEFGCHGGLIITNTLVQALIQAGARPAEPGEFTKRAFLNRKLDLTQAEAVGDLIHAVSEQGSQTAARQLMGGFTKKLADLREKLMELCGLLELELDFSQEDIELINKHDLVRRIEETQHFCRTLAESYRSSEILRTGFAVGIVGYPNAGKSSLLNALLERKRALVSATPGTTRDYLEETLHLSGMAVKLIDTAGFRDSGDMIEVEGIRLAESLLEQCNLVLVLNDIGVSIDHSAPLLEHLRTQFPHAEFALVHNKIDALQAPSNQPLSNQPLSNQDTLFISAHTGEGIDSLKTFIVARAQANTQGVSDALINARQAALLLQAASSLTKARESVESGVSNEFAAIDLREALKRIGEITGAVWNEDILNSVFGKFCIGK